MQNIILCTVVAVCFAIWPILLKKAESPNLPFATIIVMISTLLPMIIYDLMTSNQKLCLPQKYVWIALLVGLVNGIGMIFYSKLINTPNTGMYVSMVAILMPIFGLALGYFIMGQPQITITKVLGIVFAVIGLWLVTK